MTKIWKKKKHFPKRRFSWKFCSKYIYTAEIKSFKNGSQNIFVTPILIYANKRQNVGVNLNFFHQKMLNWYLGSYKKEGENIKCVLTRDAKNQAPYVPNWMLS